MLRYLTAGESHGRALVAILEGVPAGLALTRDDIAADMSRRQRGFGRGGRMQIETDEVRILSGVRDGRTLGSPIALEIANRDWANWEKYMAPEPGVIERNVVSRPRPGHADLAGALKYRHADIRDVLERSSARETAARVAVGAVARRLLAACGVRVHSHVVEIGGVHAHDTPPAFDALVAATEASEVRCADAAASAAMVAAIAAAREAGDTLGGVLEIVADGLVPGVGSYVQWDRRLDGLLAQAVLATHAIKACEIGLGFAQAARAGSQVHDHIARASSDAEGSHYTRPTNNAGGLEGGVTNGEPLVVRAAMKPISTLKQAMPSVNMQTGEAESAKYERSDVCAVPAAGVVLEAAVAFVLARAYSEKFGGDAIEEVRENLAAYRQYLATR